MLPLTFAQLWIDQVSYDLPTLHTEVLQYSTRRGRDFVYFSVIGFTLSSTCSPSWNCTAACMASSSLSTLSLQLLLRFSHAKFTWPDKNVANVFPMSHKLNKDRAATAKQETERTGYLVDTLLDDGFVGFAACRHQLCALILNSIELLLQPINLLFESLQTQQRSQFKAKTSVFLDFIIHFPISSSECAPPPQTPAAA